MHTLIFFDVPYTILLLPKYECLDTNDNVTILYWDYEGSVYRTRCIEFVYNLRYPKRQIIDKVETY